MFSCCNLPYPIPFMFSKIVILLAVLKVFTSFLMLKKKKGNSLTIQQRMKINLSGHP